jgi:RNA polymerase sigma-70 factor (ECF subfamily)
MKSNGAVPGTVVRPTWAEIHREHHHRVEALCRMLLREASDAEDVAQEVFLALYRSLPKQPPDTAWAAWLTRVAVNACRDRRRSGWWRLWRDSSDELDEGTLPATGATPEEAAVSREQRASIWHAFRALPARQREVFALRQIEGWSTEETAIALGLSQGSVKRHLSRAVHKLRAGLGGRP